MYYQDLRNIFIWQGKECTNYLQENNEFAKLRALRTYVPTCLLCLPAQHANVLCVPTCLVCLHAHMPTCLACSHTNMSCMLTCSCVTVPCMPIGSRAIIINNKNKLLVLCLFLWNKTVVHFCISLTRQKEAFRECYGKLCTLKRFDFCLSIDLRVIFKWLKNVGNGL